MNFYWTFTELIFEFILMNFNELFMNFEMYCIDFMYWLLLCTVLIFAMNFDWFIDLMILKDLINFIDLYCIVILLH